jgi:hypothetical protein
MDTPAQCEQHQEVDRSVFEKINAIRQQRNGCDEQSNAELNAKVGEIQRSN